MDVNTFFKDIIKYGEKQTLFEQYKCKLDQLKTVQAKRCGNCFHWMKNSCIPEKKHKRFKSADSLGCEAFKLGYFSGELVKQFKCELATIKEKLFKEEPPMEQKGQGKALKESE